MRYLSNKSFHRIERSKMNERLHYLTPKWVLLDVSLSPNVHIYAPPPSPFKWRIVYLNRPGQTHCDEVSMKYNTFHVFVNMGGCDCCRTPNEQLFRQLHVYRG